MFKQGCLDIGFSVWCIRQLRERDVNMQMINDPSKWNPFLCLLVTGLIVRWVDSSVYGLAVRKDFQ